jgi:hypothetical protein
LSIRACATNRQQRKQRLKLKLLLPQPVRLCLLQMEPAWHLYLLQLLLPQLGLQS